MTNKRIHLRRGTAEQIREATPSYLGELVLCLDQQTLFVCTSLKTGGFSPIPIPDEAAKGFISLYNESGIHQACIDWGK